MENQKNIKMSVEQVVDHALDSLQQNPILKGAIPAVAGAGITFLEQVEIWLRVSGAAVGLVIGCLTLYVQVKKLRKK